MIATTNNLNNVNEVIESVHITTNQVESKKPRVMKTLPVKYGKFATFTYWLLESLEMGEVIDADMKKNIRDSMHLMDTDHLEYQIEFYTAFLKDIKESNKKMKKEKNQIKKDAVKAAKKEEKLEKDSTKAPKEKKPRVSKKDKKIVATEPVAEVEEDFVVSSIEVCEEVLSDSLIVKDPYQLSEELVEESYNEEEIIRAMKEMEDLHSTSSDTEEEDNIELVNPEASSLYTTTKKEKNGRKLKEPKEPKEPKEKKLKPKNDTKRGRKSKLVDATKESEVTTLTDEEPQRKKKIVKKVEKVEVEETD